MNLMEIQNQIATLENTAKSLEQDIQSTQGQLHNETDETHITFLTDHLAVLKYEFHEVNAEIYILRQKMKFAENQQSFVTS